MSSLLASVGSLQMFTVAFVATSLVSGIIYGLAHLSWPAFRWVKIGFSVIASSVLTFCALRLFAVTFFSFLIFVGGLVGLSALQAQIERVIAGGQSGLKNHLIRALFSYICLIFVAGVFFADVVFFGSRMLPTTWHYEWGWNTGTNRMLMQSWIRELNLYAGVYGFGAGLVVAPLSISFFRRMFQTLAMRPGIDRPLRQDEIVT